MEMTRSRHLHDAKGSFVTNVIIADPEMSDAELAETVHWEPPDVRNIHIK
jgi:hypothetical protein